MQQQTPPQGRLFPDPPQEQRQTAPRFSSTATQPYEPQLRMQQTGSFPTYNSARYNTGSLQTLHSTQPVQTLPPMATMPTAQAYQASISAQQTPAGTQQQGNPMIVQTVQGTPVLVTLEQLQSVLAQQGITIQNDAEQEKSGKKGRKLRKEKDIKAGQEKAARPVKVRFSVIWFIFGLIGMGTTGVYVIKFVITLLLRLKGQL